MRYIADLVAFDDYDKPVLAVEVRKKKGTTPDWAIAMRKNLFSHGYFRHPVRYFLLGLPDIFYFWTHNDQSSTMQEPDYIGNLREIFDDYYLKLIAQADHEGLEMIFYEWLKRLPSKDIRTSPSFIINSGLYDMLRNANIKYEVAL